MIIYNDGISWERKESGNTIVCLTPCLSPLRDGFTELVGQFGFDELAVEACDVGDGLAPDFGNFSRCIDFSNFPY